MCMRITTCIGYVNMSKAYCRLALYSTIHSYIHMSTCSSTSKKSPSVSTHTEMSLMPLPIPAVHKRNVSYTAMW